MSGMFVTQENVTEGEPLWEYSDAKLELEQRRAGRGWQRTLTRGYLVLVMAGLFAWFLYGLITACIADGAAALVSQISSLFGIVTAELILGLTAFGGWGKFARLGAKRPYLRGARARAEAAEVFEAEAHAAEENALRIFDRFIVVVNGGERTVLDRMGVAQIFCVRTGDSMRLRFADYGGNVLSAAVLLPAADLPVLNKYLGRIAVAATEGPRRGIKKRLPMVLVPAIFLMAGVALLILHGTLLKELPWEVGILLCAVATVALFAAFDDFAPVKYGLLPVTAGLVFLALPVLAATAASRIAAISVWELVGSFTVVHAVLGLFFGLGPLLLFTGILGIADCIRYR